MLSEFPDHSLLAAWSAEGSEEAFTALARRYGGLLYHAARRQTGREDLAGEAAQNALLILARKAPRLHHLPCLSGWLHRTACYEAAKLLRREHRHEARMKQFLCDEPDTPETSWQDAIPLLDRAIDELPERDRQVIFLKYFDGLSFEQMARQFGGEPAAWRQRGSRAVERLRGSLARRGVSVGVPAIAAGLGTTLSQAAPTSFITSAGAASATAVSWQTLALHSLHLMKMKPAIVIPAVLLASFIPLGLQAHAVSAARQRVASLEMATASPDHTEAPQRRTASARKPQAPKTSLIALADALMAAEQGDALRKLAVEKKIRSMSDDELESLLMESLDTEMGADRRNVLVRGLFRQFCRLAEKSKMKCERVVDLATRIALTMGTQQGAVWNSAGDTVERWLETDLDTALAWFREARESGSLDHQQGTSVLAGRMFDGLHRRNPAEAVEFYRSLSDPERQAVIGGGGGRAVPELMLDLAGEIDNARLRTAALAQVFSNSEGRTPQEVREWLARVQPGENQAVEMLAHAARGQAATTSTESVLARIDWLREASEDLDFSQAAGIFLAEMAHTDRNRIRGLVDAEWQRNPDERMLATYLSRSIFHNESLIADAIPLSRRITDPELRDEALRRMLVSTRSPGEARALARKGGLTEAEINRIIPENP